MSLILLSFVWKGTCVECGREWLFCLRALRHWDAAKMRAQTSWWSERRPFLILFFITKSVYFSSLYTQHCFSHNLHYLIGSLEQYTVYIWLSMAFLIASKRKTNINQSCYLIQIVLNWIWILTNFCGPIIKRVRVNQWFYFPLTSTDFLLSACW